MSDSFNLSGLRPSLSKMSDEELRQCMLDTDSQSEGDRTEC